MQTLTIALEKIVFFPANRVTDDTSVLTLKNLVFEPLCRWEHGQSLPGLFARWDHSADGRQWRFYLRDGATFHDGVRCTADHVIDFLHGILQSVDTFGMPWSYARYFAGAVVTAQGPDCLQVQCEQPFGDIVEVFSEFYPSRETADGAPLLGTGPWRVTEWTPGQDVTLQRVAAKPGAPRRLQLVAQPDADQRWHALRDGAADIAHHLERMTAPDRRDPRFDWRLQANTLSVISYLNSSSGLFADPAARLAINHAVDVPAIIAELFHGLAVPAASVVSQFHLGSAQAALQPLAYDAERARALFGGCAASAELVLRTPQYMPDKAADVTAMVQQALANVGVRARVDTQTDRPEYAREIGRKQMGDVAIFDSSPHSTFRVLNDKVSSASRGVWWQGHDDPALEALIVQANHSVAHADRAAAYGRCLARLNANPPWLYLFNPIEIVAARPGLEYISLNHKGLLVIP
jgi:peptide/nickel transport system substrate-binding protein